MQRIIAALALSLCAAVSSHAAVNTGPRIGLDDAEKSFLDALAAIDMAEMELSQSVSTWSAQPNVRRVAQTILSEAAANYHDLFRLCLLKTYAIAPQLDDRHRDILSKLRSSRADGASERAYLDAIRFDQSELGTMLERIAGASDNDELASFAARTLMMVRKHQRLVRELADDSRG